jgi:hypothetical protein
MTIEDAIAKAKVLAEAKGIGWMEPTSTHRAKRWIFFGRARIVVRSNANRRGPFVSAEFDDETGDLIKIEYAGFSSIAG